MNQIDTLSVKRDPDFIRRRNPEGKFPVIRDFRWDVQQRLMNCGHII